MSTAHTIENLVNMLTVRDKELRSARENIDALLNNNNAQVQIIEDLNKELDKANGIKTS